jgi:predicted unusual protein kinase regulating ubiquinone biosynthesis (AarF/ABC1/UbiB family)
MFALHGGDVMTEATTDLREALHQLLRPVRDTATHTARLVKHLSGRLDALSLDLARDGGAVVRNAQAFADSARDHATTFVRATPRVTKIAQAAAALFARQRWLRLAQAARSGRAELRDVDHRELARRTAAYAAELRGGIAKLGQLASCRPDLVGPIWASELAKLQDEVPPIDVAAIRARIEAELGRPIGEVFAELADAPLAAASLAQVHAARLLDGTEVVVKVQVPGVEDVIASDIAALRALASAMGELPGVDLATLTSELARALATELDYEAEAGQLRAFRGGALVPEPIAHASSRRVLTMTRITGERLTAWLEHAAPDARDRLLGELVGEVAAQILVRGHVHADPHPGNFLVTGDGKLAILDFGCVLELSAAERASYARLVLAIAGGNHAAAASELATLGFSADDPDQLVDLAASLVGALRPGADLAQLDWQAAFADQVAQARQLGGLAIPPSFVLLGRVLAAIAGLLATHRPKLELHPLIARHLATAIA